MVSHLKSDIAVDAIIYMLAEYCHHVVELHFLYCTVDIPSFAMLEVNSSLESLKVEFCGLTDGYSPRMDISPLRNVRDVTVSSCTYGHEHMNKLLTLFPAVLVLELHSSNLSDENMMHIVDICPKVNLILLYGCKFITERSLKIAVQRWDLEFLVLRNCGNYSDELL